MWIIKSGSDYLYTINPVSGRAQWTLDKGVALKFWCREFALAMADGIGHVVEWKR